MRVIVMTNMFVVIVKMVVLKMASDGGCGGGSRVVVVAAAALRNGYDVALTTPSDPNPQHSVRGRDWVHGATPGHAEGVRGKQRGSLGGHLQQGPPAASQV